MRIPRAHLVAMTLLLLPQSFDIRPAAQAAGAIDDAEIERVVRKSMTAWGVPGVALVIVRGDQPPYLRAFGVRDRGTEDPVTPDTIFPIGSATKAFTSAAMAMLVDEGRLDWDDLVGRHLQPFHLADPIADRRATLRDLLGHTTGLTYDDFPWRLSPPARDEVIRRLAHSERDHPFRSSWHYQNVGYLAAGEVVAAASGIPWEGFVRSRIFAPLGMHRSGIRVADIARDADQASLHRSAGGVARVIAREDYDAIAPAIAIHSTARDLGQWLRFQLGDGTFDGRRLLDSKQMAEMHAPRIEVDLKSAGGRWAEKFPGEVGEVSYGLGWFAYWYRGDQVVAHGGSVDGARAAVVLVPERRLGFAILANLDETRLVEALREALIDLLVRGHESRDWDADYARRSLDREAFLDRARARQRSEVVPESAPSRRASDYAGEYVSPAYGAASITLREGGLSFRLGRSRCRLEYVGRVAGGEAFRIVDEAELKDGLILMPKDGGGGRPGYLVLYGRKFRRAQAP